jgi:hypothetical protein
MTSCSSVVTLPPRFQREQPAGGWRRKKIRLGRAMARSLLTTVGSSQIRRSPRSLI